MLNLKCWDPVSSEKMCWGHGSLTVMCIRGLEKLTQSAGKDHSLGAEGIPDMVQWHSHWRHCAHLLPRKHAARSLHWFLATGTCNRSVMDSASLIITKKLCLFGSSVMPDLPQKKRIMPDLHQGQEKIHGFKR